MVYLLSVCFQLLLKELLPLVPPWNIRNLFCLGVCIGRCIEFFDVSVVLPIEIFVDNKGDIFLAENPIVKRTKHVDTKYHFIRDYVKDGTFLIKFVNSEENLGDVFTKNPSVKSYEELSHEYVTRIENTKKGEDVGNQVPSRLFWTQYVLFNKRSRCSK